VVLGDRRYFRQLLAGTVVTLEYQGQQMLLFEQVAIAEGV
jgi:hypothetical protein